MPKLECKILRQVKLNTKETEVTMKLNKDVGMMTLDEVKAIIQKIKKR